MTCGLEIRVDIYTGPVPSIVLHPPTGQTGRGLTYTRQCTPYESPAIAIQSKDSRPMYTWVDDRTVPSPTATKAYRTAIQQTMKLASWITNVYYVQKHQSHQTSKPDKGTIVCKHLSPLSVFMSLPRHTSSPPDQIYPPSQAATRNPD